MGVRHSCDSLPSCILMAPVMAYPLIEQSHNGERQATPHVAQSINGQLTFQGFFSTVNQWILQEMLLSASSKVLKQDICWCDVYAYVRNIILHNPNHMLEGTSVFGQSIFRDLGEAGGDHIWIFSPDITFAVLAVLQNNKCVILITFGVFSFIYLFFHFLF